MWGWQGQDSERDAGEIRLVAEQGSFSLTSSQAALFAIFPSISSLNVFLSQSLLCLLLPLCSHTLNVLMRVQEREALTGLEGKPGNQPDFPLYYHPLSPPLPRP